MNLNEIKQLIDLVNSSDLQETIIEEGEFKITLRRFPYEAAPMALTPAAPAVPQAARARAPCSSFCRDNCHRSGFRTD